MVKMMNRDIVEISLFHLFLFFFYLGFFVFVFFVFHFCLFGCGSFKRKISYELRTM